MNDRGLLDETSGRAMDTQRFLTLAAAGLQYSATDNNTQQQKGEPGGSYEGQRADKGEIHTLAAEHSHLITTAERTTATHSNQENREGKRGLGLSGAGFRWVGLD